MVDLGVYVSTLNEDVLIEACLKNLVKVFPQVEVIDLGSTDKTLEIVCRLNVPINNHILAVRTSKHGYGAEQDWIRLKNEYKDKHDWLLLLDGDEIFDEENLLKLKAKVGVEDPYTAYQIGWRMVRETPTGIQKSAFRISGTKLFKSSDYCFRRSWPTEVLGVVEGKKDKREPRQECDIWCWHGVLLNRSNSVPEAKSRMNKRLERAALYDRELEWEGTYRWPWITDAV